MNAVLQAAHRRIPSFRREDGGTYAVFVAIYSRAYRWRMNARHRRGRHGQPMANGRCQWCGGQVPGAAVRLEP